MNQKYEILILSNNKITICTPGAKITTTDCSRYITSHGGDAGFLSGVYETIPFILGEGWEPCAFLTGYAMPTFQFRRKIN